MKKSMLPKVLRELLLDLVLLVLLYGCSMVVLEIVVCSVVEKYPEVLGGVEIGNGTIRVKIPLIDKVIELDTNDLTAFKETLTSK